VYEGVTPHDYQIVGLVRNTKYFDLRDDYGPIAYYPALQGERNLTSTSILLRSNLDLQALLPSLRKAIAEVSPEISINFSVLDQQVKDSLLRERLLALLSAFFGALAASLATIGLYGLIAYMVTRRTNEIGIRMALGAAPRQILTMVLEEAGRLVVIGVIVGVVLAFVTRKAAASLLFGLKPYDPVTMTTAAAALTAVAVAATLVPARRAAHLDPMAALREE
jgi:ABC-type antimicrobial peptide transport system permease subunit